MTAMYTIALEHPSAILVQGGTKWRRIVGLNDPPCVPKVKLTVQLSSKARAVELSIDQANELIQMLMLAIVEAEQITEQRNGKIVAGK